MKERQTHSGGGALTDHSSSGCRNPLIQIGSETFFLLFWLNLTLVVFLMCVLGMVSKQNKGNNNKS